jgi:TolB protein
MTRRFFKYGALSLSLIVGGVLLSRLIGAWIGGEILAYSAWVDGDKELFALDVNRHVIWRLTENDNNDFAPVWSPDGKRLAFASERDGTPDIYIMNAYGGDVQRVGDQQTDAWALDAGAIAVIVDSTGAQELDAFLLRADSPGAQRLLKAREAISDPVFSQDETQIAFVARRGITSAIYILTAADGRIRQLTPYQTLTESPSWRP